ncbi:MAG: sigma 54-interacting transcriptional regulator [Verrucomicrobiota bacterium]|jgi:transcriptional regulator with GAF, ATPase, and Fis domain
MPLGPDYEPEFDSLRDLLLEIAPERSVEHLLRKVVQRLAERPHALVARLWLLEKGDLCASCPMRPRCPDQTRCLHLVASAESSVWEPGEEARAAERELRRIPAGVGAIGRIAATGQPMVSNNPGKDLDGFGEPGWAGRQGIRGFGGQPIIFQNEVLGVIAQFNRIPTPNQSPAWLRIFADHIAAAIVNARAFEEIEQLKAHLELENTFLKEEVQEAKALGEMIGQSAALKRLLRQVEMVARTDATVLILGESGTGKELIAREIHKNSRRGQRPLIRVNCASIPRELYESEFFGHVKGAFTGAFKDRAGRFEAAQGGTLFLDEVGEIPLELQSKLLRVLQEGQYERVGEERTRTVDVRIIAATNRDLPKDVETGRFRQDLYYRLNVFPMKVAPLRERKDDIPLLAAHFLDKAIRKLNLPPARLTQAHIAQFQNHDWPGNVRELQNTIERALILAQNGVLWFDLPDSQRTTAAGPVAAGTERAAEPAILSDAEFQQRERDNVLAALNKTGWKIHGPGGTAELLGVKPTTLISRLKKMGLKKPAAKAALAASGS